MAQFYRDLGIPDLRCEAGRVALEAAGGGRLGVIGVHELVVGVPDFDHEARQWNRLVDPVLPERPNCWRGGAGPAIRLIPAAKRQVERVVVRVNDVAAADAAWTQVDRSPLCDLVIEFTS
jgi:hypothetical protein